MAARGFTLVELLVVLALIGAVLSLAVPRLSAVSGGGRLETTAENLVAQLRRVRSEAITGGKAVAFQVDLENRVYGKAGVEDVYEIPPAIKVGLTSASYAGSVTGIGTFYFFPDGSTTGGRIRLAKDEEVLTVEIDWLSGRTVVREQVQ
ncbi:MAG: GspH/FimT family pseudopilin [Kiloniellales bacterium]|nr:GspH/FimT family pseudopilin [Kiloniellales bacterium]